MIQQFIGAFLLASSLVVSGSLLWPVITKRERPAVLQAVRDKVVETDAGKQAEAVLGTYSVPGNVPQTVSSVSASVVTQVQTIVQKKTDEIVTKRLIEEVVKRFETLPTQDKQEVKTVICNPSQ